jgi:group I intron endonuclease
MAFEVYVVRRVNDEKVMYCGYATGGVRKRWSEHKSKALSQEAPYPLYHAIRKYGSDAFEIEHVASATDFENLQLLEIAMIAQYGTFVNGYNLTEGGGGNLGWKPSEATRNKWSEQRRGKIIPAEQRQMISKSLKGRQSPAKGTTWTPDRRVTTLETRAATNAANKATHRARTIEMVAQLKQELQLAA